MEGEIEGEIEETGPGFNAIVTAHQPSPAASVPPHTIVPGFSGSPGAKL